jgi:hypothetical protein
MTSKDEARNLVVAGDIGFDHHLYAGKSNSSNISERVAEQVNEYGGAHVLKRLIDHLFANADRGLGQRTWDVFLGVSTESIGFDAYTVWEPHSSKHNASDGNALIWRARPFVGYASNPRPVDQTQVPNADLLVLDDAGFLIPREATGNAQLPCVGAMVSSCSK